MLSMKFEIFFDPAREFCVSNPEIGNSNSYITETPAAMSGFSNEVEAPAEQPPVRHVNVSLHKHLNVQHTHYTDDECVCGVLLP